LVPALRAAVWIAIQNLQERDDVDAEELIRIAQQAQSILRGPDAADLFFGGPGCARHFDALATALAVLAHAPGGVDRFETHWCIDHKICMEAA
jgi:hypothetical protein